MKKKVLNSNDNTVLDIQKIFDLIQYGKYSEAFLLSSQAKVNDSNKNRLFHEWVIALNEFYSCNKRESSIKMLEKIKPGKLENELHFRIINSLMIFYLEDKNKENFLKYKDLLLSNIHTVSNNALLIKILSNICNGFYELEYYTESLNFCEKIISISKKHDLYNFRFCKTLMIKIMNLFYLGKHEEANELKNNFECFLKIIDKQNLMECLDNAINKFYEKVNVCDDDCYNNFFKLFHV
ncbi:hypothetical protein PV797_01910 [Clostridiaceae bacterium M8S5]|nr:hypothetical protein PV797_01910 [Clostridiaceae bacterium M8S5]